MAMTFPVSGVEVSPIVPPLVALVVSAFTSVGGVSGAFLLLPFQVSVLGFISPAVSPTNLVYNIVAIPGGVVRYICERRMVWPLTCSIIVATLPGTCLGAIVRIKYLPDPRPFKFFVGWVLLYIGGRLVYDLTSRARIRHNESKVGEAESRDLPVNGARPRPGAASGSSASADFLVRTIRCSWRRITYSFAGQTFTLSTPRLFPLMFLVGIVGGTYGIGGGAIVGPLLVTLFRLPVHTIAGAVLTSTFVTSIAGVIFYRLAAVHYAEAGLAIAPDWLLGVLFGVGGLVGTYVGARCQKYVSASAIKLILAAVLLIVALRYIGGFFR
jgi:uncharacterized membrane protein YfcA